MTLKREEVVAADLAVFLSRHLNVVRRRFNLDGKHWRSVAVARLRVRH